MSVFLQMTDMQMLDDAGSVVPKTNDIDLFEDWKLLGDYSLDNAFIPAFLSAMTVLFAILGVVGWYADKRMSKDLNALEQRMYLLGGDVTIDPHEQAENKTQSWKQKCFTYWKCWKCNKVRIRRTTCLRSNWLFAHPHIPNSVACTFDQSR